MRALLLLALVGVSVASCDGGDPLTQDQLSEGQNLPLTRYPSGVQPPSRAAYARMGVITGYGSVHVFDPGTGAAPPRLVRSLKLPGLAPEDAQIDREGYLWVAVPDGLENSVHRAAYVIDPFAARVVRVVKLEEAVRASAHLVIGPDRVYLMAWRNGFSAGVGSVSKACVQDTSQCTATLLTELGNVGLGVGKPLQLDGEWLYASNASNTRDRRAALTRIDAQSGEIEKQNGLTGVVATSPTSIFLSVSNPQNAQQRWLLRLDKETLSEQARVEINVFKADWQGDFLYTHPGGRGPVDVRSATTLELVRTIDIGAAGEVRPNFGFVVQDRLMITPQATLNVVTGEMSLDPAYSADQLGQVPGAPRMPEGSAYAF